MGVGGGLVLDVAVGKCVCSGVRLPRCDLGFVICKFCDP